MKRIFTAIVLTLSLFAAFGCKQKGANDFIGVQMYSVRDYLDPLDEGVANIAKAGYSFVEMANYNNEAGLFYGMAPADFKALCEKNGLQVLSSHTNGPNPDRTPMEDCIAWWQRAIEHHKAVGCKTIVAPAMAADSLQTLARYCELFNKVGEMCSEAGMKFGYHNHDNEFKFKYTQEDGTDITWYDYMLANTDPDKVFFQLDLYWAVRGGVNPVDLFKANPGRFYMWHVKDEVEVGDPATGCVDFPEIYKYASLAGMQYQVVEQEGFPQGADPYESIKRSCDYVKTMRPE